MSKKGFLNEIVDMDDPFTSFASEIIDDTSSTGFIDTGSYILNAALSTSIYGGIPNSSVTAFAGPEAVGKSYVSLGILKNFLSSNERSGAILYETEGTPKKTIQSRGIDPTRVVVSQPDTLQKFRERALNSLTKYENMDEEDRPKLLIILDSLGMLSTTKEMEDSLAGEETRDMTRAQLVKAIFRTLTLKLSKLKVPMVITNHTYANMNAYGNPQVLSGGSGIRYAASTIVLLSKSKDKDEKTKDVVGNIITCKMNKNRYAKENTEVDIRLSYTKGLDRYYGLSDLAIKQGIFKKSTKGIELPDGTFTKSSNVDNEPEKYYTKDVLKRLEDAAKKEFSYGE